VTEIRYANLHKSPPALRVQTVGQTYGPPGGDNWQQVAVLPADTMPSGSGQYAVIVTGKIGSHLLAGTGALRGVVQLCLGTTAGARFAHMRVSHPVTELLDEWNGIPFQFVLLMSSGFPDPVQGSSFDPSSSQLCVYARTYLNGDAQSYYAEFTVADLTWLWFDLARIPNTKWTADRDTATANLVAAAPSAFTRVSPSAFGAAGQIWLNFGNVWYEPRGNMAQAPRFQFFATPDGTWASRVPRVGSHGRWGQNRFPTTGNLIEVPCLQQGCFWLYTHAGSTAKAGYSGQDPNSSARVFRWTHFAVRVDDLPDFLGRSDGGELVAGVRVDGPWRDTYVTKERPAPNPGLLTEPIVMAHLVPTFGQQAASYAAWVTEAGRPELAFGDSQCFPQADGVRGEAVSAMSFGRRTFSPLSPAMQWRIHMVGSQSLSPAALQQLYDLHFLQFHPVSDPAASSTPPYPVPLPILVVPGQQSASAAALQPPPTAPSSATTDRIQDDRPGINGGTGYVRTWPLGAKLLREFGLTWGPLAIADAQAVFDFLVANPAWRYTPPGGSALAVLNSTQPTLDADAGQLTAVVSVDVAVLVYTA
jgi:hypothetical protein